MKIRWEVGAGLVGGTFIFLGCMGFQVTTTGNGKPVDALILSLLAGGGTGITLAAAATTATSFREQQPSPPAPIAPPAPAPEGIDEAPTITFPVELIEKLGGTPEAQMQRLVTYIMSAHPTDPDQASRLIEAASTYCNQLRVPQPTRSKADPEPLLDDLWDTQPPPESVDVPPRVTWNNPPQPAPDLDIPPVATTPPAAHRNEFGGVPL
jgi:hypothetical protein